MEMEIHEGNGRCSPWKSCLFIGKRGLTTNQITPTVYLSSLLKKPPDWLTDLNGMEAFVAVTSQRFLLHPHNLFRDIFIVFYHV
ncbi:hypothetical protein GDO81_029881 [Engystomops pustulosus]|uniref:Uncharacterized protein n=1 Tax=Engystomops pustulosus TaxID=76066 RepID=A0AAV6YBL8_ENGPU|nr:hypothetical protein GDO81_029881 [Engystomops pustulosus]